MKINFRLPNTKFSVVIWHRGGKLNKVIMPTPPNNEALRSEMLRHKVGYSEIRAVQSVDPNTLAGSMFRNL